jgi:uncharacterized protein
LLVVKTYVAASTIEGVGVFAVEAIGKGSVVWRTDPIFDMLVPIAAYRSAEPPFKHLLQRHAYPSPDRPGYLVYEIDNGRFMNHSDAPNTDFSAFGYGTAIADIEPDEELTCNYRQFYAGFGSRLAQGEDVFASS